MLDLVTLRRMVWKPSGFETDNEVELPRTEIDLYLNRALWELCEKFHFREAEKRGTFPTVIGERSYEIPTASEGIKQLSVVDPDSDTNRHYDLERMEPETYESMYIDTENEWSDPTHYVREGCGFLLWPTPYRVVTLVIRRWIDIADITQTNNVPEIPRAWHELIGFGGLWRALLDLGDFNRSNMIRSNWVATVNSMTPTEVKEKGANTRHAGLEVIGRDYDQAYDIGLPR